ncbi:hypothetical protein [Halomarina rubra]|uniref:Uncharacterized protein n=1 Tax=Halomarina rubra TaxID=2071873 RepID=A0ABD6B292_9EURY|nr:hypothetical protein [Halomarina rubra]
MSILGSTLRFTSSDGYKEFLGRVPVFAALLLQQLLIIMALHNSMTETEAAEFMDAMTVQAGPFAIEMLVQGFAWTMMFWTVSPMLAEVYHIVRGGPGGQEVSA